MVKELSGPSIAPGEVDEVYSSTAIDLGTRIKDDEGNEYIFMRGVASTIKGSWVTWDEDKVTTLLAANAKGPVAVAMAAFERRSRNDKHPSASCSITTGM